MVENMVLRLAHENRIVVWHLPRPALETALEQLIDRGLIVRAQQDLNLSQGSDALSVVEEGGGKAPQQWDLLPGAEAIPAVVGAPPMVDLRLAVRA